MPLPLSTLDVSGVIGVFTDIDDTLTRDGRMPASALAAIERLVACGVAVVPVTGRSAGWAHMAMHLWPVDAVIAESGGLYLDRDPAHRLRWTFHADPARVRAGRQALERVVERLLADQPALAAASDNAFRLVDVAIDYCEAVTRAPEEVVQAAIDTLRGAGFHARASTVHINAWEGDFDKAPMALRYLGERRSGAAADPCRWVFIGDAPNDESMFSAFLRSVGVANIARFLPTMRSRPACVTVAPFADGFVELAERLISARR